MPGDTSVLNFSESLRLQSLTMACIAWNRALTVLTHAPAAPAMPGSIVWARARTYAFHSSTVSGVEPGSGLFREPALKSLIQRREAGLCVRDFAAAG